MKINAFVKPLLLASLVSSTAMAGTGAPSVDRVSVIIDKPSYNPTYSVGVSANASSMESTISTVSVTHNAILGDSLGSWSLEPRDGAWWSWAKAGPLRGNGKMDGSLEITAFDAAGNATTVSGFHFQPDQEIDLPTLSVHQTSTGFKVESADVTGADFYNLWLWDSIEKRYPSSQQVSHIDDLKEVSFDGLVNGRSYNLYLIANNRFTGGQLDANDGSLFRASALQTVTFNASPVPEPQTYLLLTGGLALVCSMARRQKTKH